MLLVYGRRYSLQLIPKNRVMIYHFALKFIIFQMRNLNQNLIIFIKQTFFFLKIHCYSSEDNYEVRK